MFYQSEISHWGAGVLTKKDLHLNKRNPFAIFTLYFLKFTVRYVHLERPSFETFIMHLKRFWKEIMANLAHLKWMCGQSWSYHDILNLAIWIRILGKKFKIFTFKLNFVWGNC